MYLGLEKARQNYQNRKVDKQSIIKSCDPLNGLSLIFYILNRGVNPPKTKINIFR